ncbi:hypothetical protein OIU34_36865 [Pararhizobium sp. BT-229]|nr:hypothetical protein [Pararhizobium sp. BT-229]MCV9967408.1 hypothetical protein [Pararhizobium sp. BT-229]
MNVDFAITGRHHTFAFRNKQVALEATTTWEKHVKQPAHSHR